MEIVCKILYVQEYNGINVRTVRSNHIVLCGSLRFKHDSSNSTLGKNILANSLINLDILKKLFREINIRNENIKYSHGIPFLMIFLSGYFRCETVSLVSHLLEFIF